MPTTSPRARPSTATRRLSNNSTAELESCQKKAQSNHPSKCPMRIQRMPLAFVEFSSAPRDPNSSRKHQPRSSVATDYASPSFTKRQMARPIFEPLQAALPQHFLYFLPLPQGHGSLRPVRGPSRRIVGVLSSLPSTKYHLPSFFSNEERSRCGMVTPFSL